MAEALKSEDMTLPALFAKVRAIHLSATESSVNQETLRKGCELLATCESMVSKLGLFSPNETKDDISDSNLKYLLVPFYLGELTEKLVSEDRPDILKRSQEKLKEFLSFCEAMELLPKEELEAFNNTSSGTFSDRRAQKIARFKRQKAAEARLVEIKERKERRTRSAKACTLSANVEAGDEDSPEDDGEEEREAWITTISLCILKALDLLEMLKKESEMLSAIKDLQLKEGDELSGAMLEERARKADSWHRESAAAARHGRAAQPITCATFAQDVLEGRALVSEGHRHRHAPMVFGPASVVGGALSTERARMAAQVFQPSHRLPSMSIEEAGEREMEMMRTWEERNKRAVEEANATWHREDSREDDDDDEAVMKARAWDDWKDDNPRGAGNSKLTPCG